MKLQYRRKWIENYPELFSSLCCRCPLMKKDHSLVCECRFVWFKTHVVSIWVGPPNTCGVCWIEKVQYKSIAEIPVRLMYTRFLFFPYREYFFSLKVVCNMRSKVLYSFLPATH